MKSLVLLVAIASCKGDGCSKQQDRTPCMASCGIAQDNCQARCGDNVECHAGCQKGYQACVQSCGKDGERR